MVLSAKLRNRKLATPCTNYGTVGENMESGVLFVAYFTRYRYKLVSCRSSEKNRYQNALTVCNVALDSVVSDVFGKSSTSIIDYLLEQSGTSIDHEVIASKLLKRLNTLVPGTLTIFRIILISQISKKIHPSGPFSLISNFFIPILTKFLLAFL